MTELGVYPLINNLIKITISMVTRAIWSSSLNKSMVEFKKNQIQSKKKKKEFEEDFDLETLQ